MNSRSITGEKIPSHIPIGEKTAEMIIQKTGGTTITSYMDSIFGIPSTAHILGGSIMGMIGLFGAFGIMITQFIGGRVFDAWGPNWPFIIVGMSQVFIMIGAIVIRIIAPGDKEPKTEMMKA